MKKFIAASLCLYIVLSVSGCALFLAGAAGGAGTAVWLSNKLVQTVDAPFSLALQASKSALEKLDLKLVKETKNDTVAQLISEYYGGEKIWIDVRRITAKASRLEVRVGLMGDEIAARKILDQIVALL